MAEADLRLTLSAPRRSSCTFHFLLSLDGGDLAGLIDARVSMGWSTVWPGVAC